MTDLFRTPIEAIDEEALRRFLDDRLEETLVLEYKARPNPHVLQTIAAMANTAGGLILVGVGAGKRSEKGKPSDVPGVDPSDRDRLVSQCFAKLEPPFEPEIAVVPLSDTNHCVLVVRVDPARAEPPVVLDGTVYVRLSGQTQAADRYRISTLFAPRTAQGMPMPSHGRPRMGGGHLPVSPEAEALILRVALLGRTRPGLVLVDSAARRLLLESVRASRAEAIFAEMTSVIARDRTHGDWHRQGFITASCETLVRERVELVDETALLTGQAVLELQGSRVSTGWASLRLDLAFERTPQLEHATRRVVFVFEELVRLVAGVVDSILDELTPPVLALVSPEPRPAPRYLSVALDTGVTPIAEYVQLPRWPRARGSINRPGPYFESPEGVDLANPATRRSMLREWFSEFLFQQGYSEFESELEHVLT